MAGTGRTVAVRRDWIAVRRAAAGGGGARPVMRRHMQYVGRCHAPAPPRRRWGDGDPDRPLRHRAAPDAFRRFYR